MIERLYFVAIKKQNREKISCFHQLENRSLNSSFDNKNKIYGLKEMTLRQNIYIVLAEIMFVAW